MGLRNLDNVMPAITLDFYNSKQLDPRVTFTRASFAPASDPGSGTGTAGGEVLMFNVDVPRLTDQGLLIEESRTNYLLYSQDLTVAPWTRTKNPGTLPDPVKTANAGVAPDGTNTATRIDYTSLTGVQYQNVVQEPTLAAGNYSYSFYVKAATPADVGKTVRAQIYTGTVDVHLAHILTDEWVRLELNRDAGGGFTQPSIEQFPDQGAMSCLVWGCQFELGAFVTSYIPTTTAGVTRAADVCEITGDNFSSWYNQSETTLVIHQSINQTNSTNYDPWRLYGNGSLRGQVGDNVPGLIYMDYNFPTFTGYLPGYSAGNNWQLFEQNKAAFSWYIPPASSPLTAQTEASGSLNGQSPVTANNLAPIEDRTSFRPLSSNSGTIERISFYPTRVTDAALRGLTQP